eukprot:358375-Chlamydomonas_euryale.AAC.2
MQTWTHASMRALPRKSMRALLRKSMRALPRKSMRAHLRKSMRAHLRKSMHADLNKLIYAHTPTQVHARTCVAPGPSSKRQYATRSGWCGSTPGDAKPRGARPSSAPIAARISSGVRTTRHSRISSTTPTKSCAPAAAYTRRSTVRVRPRAAHDVNVAGGGGGGGGKEGWLIAEGTHPYAGKHGSAAFELPAAFPTRRRQGCAEPCAGASCSRRAVKCLTAAADAFRCMHTNNATHGPGALKAKNRKDAPATCPRHQSIKNATYVGPGHPAGRLRREQSQSSHRDSPARQNGRFSAHRRQRLLTAENQKRRATRRRRVWKQHHDQSGLMHHASLLDNPL